jgi:hypothetical protein
VIRSRRRSASRGVALWLTEGNEHCDVKLRSAYWIAPFMKKIRFLRESDPQASLLSIGERAIMELDAYNRFAPGRFHAAR